MVKTDGVDIARSNSRVSKGWTRPNNSIVFIRDSSVKIRNRTWNNVDKKTLQVIIDIERETKKIISNSKNIALSEGVFESIVGKPSSFETSIMVKKSAIEELPSPFNVPGSRHNEIYSIFDIEVTIAGKITLEKMLQTLKKEIEKRLIETFTNLIGK